MEVSEGDIAAINVCPHYLLLFLLSTKYRFSRNGGRYNYEGEMVHWGGGGGGGGVWRNKDEEMLYLDIAVSN